MNRRNFSEHDGSGTGGWSGVTMSEQVDEKPAEPGGKDGRIDPIVLGLSVGGVLAVVLWGCWPVTRWRASANRVWPG
ncbi:hypothetical protein GCM10029963_63330 [Micromonospora andamanensis]